MKKYIALIAAVATLASCSSDNEMMNDRQVEIQALKNETRNKQLAQKFEILSEELAMATIYEPSSNRVIDTQMLRRSISTIALGSRETSTYGEWIVVAAEASEPNKVATRPGEGLFTVTTNHIAFNSTISNGEVEFYPEYTLEYEECTWSNGDTTFVFPCTWEVNNEVVVENAGVVTDEINTIFCNEYVQKANELGNLTLTSTGTPTDENTAVNADFSVTVFGSKWLVGCSVHMSDGTLACALEPDGTPVASRANFWAGDVNASYNGAYYVEVKGEGAWYPAIARDRNDGMSWTVDNKEIDMISYAEADQYANWGNNNKSIYGQHSVKLTGYSVTDDAQSQTLTFFYNGVETGTLCYANLK